jgi:hypothetical protein
MAKKQGIRPKRRSRRWWEAAIAAILTLGIGVGVGFAAGVYTADRGIQFISGLVASALSGVLMFGLYYIRTEDRLDDIAVSLLLRDLGYDTTILFGKNSEELTNLLRMIAQYYRDYTSVPNLLRSIIDESLNQAGEMLISRVQESTRFGWEDIRKRAIDVLKEAKSGDVILSTSYVVSQVWWVGTPGTEYLVAKRDAAGRGAKITQIFISPDKDSLRNDENIIKELAKPPTGKDPKPIEICVIRSAAMLPEELRDILLLKRSKDPLAFELDLKDRSLPKGFIVFHGHSIESIDSYFEAISDRCPVKYDPNQYPVFDDFINEVFKR